MIELQLATGMRPGEVTAMRGCDLDMMGKLPSHHAKDAARRAHPHQLRHNAATRLRKQYGLEAAQVILGHKSLAVTEIPAEKNVEAAKRIMGEVG